MLMSTHVVMRAETLMLLMNVGGVVRPSSLFSRSRYSFLPLLLHLYWLGAVVSEVICSSAVSTSPVAAALSCFSPNLRY